MGGEFYLLCDPVKHLIGKNKWNQMLDRLKIKVEEIRDKIGRHRLDFSAFRFDHEKYGFYFEKDERILGIPRDPKGEIESLLGGRGRHDMEDYIVILADILTEFVKFFPGKAAIVLCDGWSGYGDQNIYFDGRTDYWVNISWDKWPWHSEQSMTAAEYEEHIYELHETVINNEYTRILEWLQEEDKEEDKYEQHTNTWCVIF